MSLRRGTEAATPPITASAREMGRLLELYKIMNEVGFASMTVNELEEWSYLMAKSLEGKGDPHGPVAEAHTARPEGLVWAL